MREKEVIQSSLPLQSSPVRKSSRIHFHLRDYFQHLTLFSRDVRLYLLGTFFTGYTFAVFQLLLNLYLKERGFSEGFIGNILSATALGTLIISVPFAILLHRVSYRLILISSLFLALIGYLLLGFLSNPTGLLAASFISGVSMTGVRLVAPPFFMRNSTPKERTHLFSVNYGTWIAAAIVGSLTGGYLVSLFQLLGGDLIASLKWALLSSIAIGLIGAIPYWFIRSESTSDTNPGSVWSWENFRQRGGFYFRLSLPLFVLGLGAGLIIPFLNLYFKDSFNQSAHQIGIYFAWLQVFMLTGILAAPILSKRLGMIRTLVFTELISIPFMLILAFTGSLPLAVGAFFLRGAMMNMAQPLSVNFSMEAVRAEEHSLINGMITLAWNLSWVLSASIGGKLIELHSYAAPLVIAAVLYIFSAGLYFYFFAGDEKKSAASEALPMQEA
ncbi:MAG: MFS transporter [candidate division Zixibacteria bacterium]|nr:MFS transporter [candidate division Zixibacteria bacterium]